MAWGSGLKPSIEGREAVVPASLGLGRRLGGSRGVASKGGLERLDSQIEFICIEAAGRSEGDLVPPEAATVTAVAGPTAEDCKLGRPFGSSTGSRRAAAAAAEKEA